MPCESKKAFLCVNSSLCECSDRAIAVKIWSYGRPVVWEIVHESKRSKNTFFGLNSGIWECGKREKMWSYAWIVVWWNALRFKNLGKHYCVWEQQCGEMLGGYNSQENGIVYGNSSVCKSCEGVMVDKMHSYARWAACVSTQGAKKQRKYYQMWEQRPIRMQRESKCRENESLGKKYYIPEY